MKVFDERNAFNFYRSYYDVFLLLPDESKLEFVKALFKAQFEGDIVDPLDSNALFAFRSQMHSIKKQVEGFEKGKKTYPNGNPTKGKDKGKGKEVQEKEEEKEKEQVKEVSTYKHPLSIWVNSLPQLNQLKYPLTDEEAERLISEFDKGALKEVFESMSNKNGLTKSYQSANLTVRSWINLRRKTEINYAMPKKSEDRLTQLKKERGWE
jgi:hypothetical protein